MVHKVESISGKILMSIGFWSTFLKQQLLKVANRLNMCTNKTGGFAGNKNCVVFIAKNYMATLLKSKKKNRWQEGKIHAAINLKIFLSTTHHMYNSLFLSYESNCMKATDIFLKVGHLV